MSASHVVAVPSQDELVGFAMMDCKNCGPKIGQLFSPSQRKQKKPLCMECQRRDRKRSPGRRYGLRGF